MPECDFEKLLSVAVDKGLSSLGETSKEVVYFHLEKTFEIKRQEIPRKIENFEKAIERIFGLGANFLEILIMKHLYELIGGNFKWNESIDFTFTEYVAVAKRHFIKKTHTQLEVRLPFQVYDEEIH